VPPRPVRAAGGSPHPFLRPGRRQHPPVPPPRPPAAPTRSSAPAAGSTHPFLRPPSAGSIARVKISADLDGGTGEESDTGNQARLVVAVDGPSGAGKSSASRGAAIALGVRYLDTGSMYRALTWWLLDRGVAVSDAGLVGELAGEPLIEVGTDPRAPWTQVNGADVSAAIRTREVTGAVSAVAAVPRVRAHLIAQQRDIIASADGIVAEGRDIGTVVAPDAPVKVFLTADSTARADRRAGETSWSAASTQVEQDRRDRLDAAQSGKADDAVEIDSTQLDLDQVIDIIVRLARERGGVPHPRQQTR
jgi:cytidylate kinase